jgi:hypothetical protein
MNGVCGANLRLHAQLRDMKAGGTRRMGIIVTGASEWISALPEGSIPRI